jgi:hypothetical protein
MIEEIQKEQLSIDEVVGNSQKEATNRIRNAGAGKRSRLDDET